MDRMHNTSLTGLASIRGMVVDADGVLWLGDTPLPGLIHFFEVLRNRQIRFVLATNNNTQSVEEIVQKARRFGVEIFPDEVVNSSIATVEYLKSRYSPGSRIYVIGEAPIKTLISSAGFEIADRDAAAVVATMDHQFTYEMLERGALLIRSGADFIAPNPDLTYPTPEGLVPGAGTILAALSTASGCQPLIVGKPEIWIYRIATQRMQLSPDETASVGDRLDTDIAGGQRLGLKTILMLSGVTSPEEAATSDIHPTWIFDNIEELAKVL